MAFAITIFIEVMYVTTTFADPRVTAGFCPGLPKGFLAKGRPVAAFPVAIF